MFIEFIKEVFIEFIEGVRFCRGEQGRGGAV